jgi:hypothetical protein
MHNYFLIIDRVHVYRPVVFFRRVRVDRVENAFVPLNLAYRIKIDVNVYRTDIDSRFHIVGIINRTRMRSTKT